MTCIIQIVDALEFLLAEVAKCSGEIDALNREIDTLTVAVESKKHEQSVVAARAAWLTSKAEELKSLGRAVVVTDDFTPPQRRATPRRSDSKKLIDIVTYFVQRQEQPFNVEAVFHYVASRRPKTARKTVRSTLIDLKNHGVVEPLGPGTYRAVRGKSARSNGQLAESPVLLEMTLAN